MRVTPKITTSNFIRSIHRQTAAILRAQEQIASQKRINKISDDPIGMGRVLGYRSNIAAIEQYEEAYESYMKAYEIDPSAFEVSKKKANKARMLEEKTIQ